MALYTPEYKPTGDEIAVLHTSKGDIRVQLAGKDAPIHVGNFVELARKGVRSFLTKKGYEIVEEDFKFREKKAFRADTIPFVAKDDGDLVFVEVNASDDPTADFDEIEAGGMTRVDFEAAAFEFLRVSNLKDASVRFDSICVRFVADDRALIRHHIDCMEVD